jgi:hypothetical protein
MYMNRRLIFIALVCLLTGFTLRGYSGPKTISINDSANPQEAPLAGGIPADYGDLISVDNGFLYFVDGDGTIRRVAINAQGTLEGAVVTIPRKWDNGPRGER